MEDLEGGSMLSQVKSFKDFCETFRELSNSGRAPEELVIEGQMILSEYLANPDLMLDHLVNVTENMTDDEFIPIDVNEISIYRDPNRMFSVRIFVWEPNYPYQIHDHGSWGVMGSLVNQVRETKYRRLDDGSQCDYAELEVRAETVIQPGQTTFVLPLNEGIHRMMAFGKKSALSLHVYGKPLRTGFIHGYIMESNSAFKMYPVKVQRRILAVRALELIVMASDSNLMP
jgi:predicted metal-dependent enzyme (double-stranded beta helix superfamily)